MTDETVTIGFRAEVSGLKKSLKEAEAATEDLKKEVEETQDAAANKSTGLKGAFGQVSDKIGAAKGKLGSMAGKLKGLAAPLLLAGAAITGATIAAKKLYAVSAETMRMYDPARAERYTGALIKQTRKLKTTLGAVLAPVFQGFTKALTAITGWVNGFVETILKAVGYIQGLLGITQSVNETITNTVYDAADAAEAASAGLASFDNVATLNFGELGDMDQAQRISELMKQSAESGAKMRKSISDALTPIKEIGRYFEEFSLGRMWDQFAASAGSAWDNIKSKGGEVLGGIGETLGTAWDGLKTGFGTAWDGLKTKIGELGGHISASVLSAAGTIKTALGGAWTAVKGKIGELGGQLSASVHGAVEGIKTTLGGLWTAIKARVSGIGDTLTKSFKGAWDWLAERIGEIPGKFKDAFKRAADGLKSAFSGALNGLRDTAKKLAKDIGDALAGVFDFVKGVYDATIGRVIEGLKEAIRKLDEFISKLDIVGKAKDLGGKASDAIQGGFNWIKDHIPKLASGGVVEPNAPMLAVVGDNMREREVVSPLSTIRQAVSEALAVQGGAAPGNIELTVNLDGRTIARGTYDYLKAEAARRGTSGGW